MLMLFVGKGIRSWQETKQKGHTANFFFVPTEDDPFLHRANIEDSHSLVA